MDLLFRLLFYCFSFVLLDCVLGCLGCLLVASFVAAFVRLRFSVVVLLVYTFYIGCSCFPDWILIVLLLLWFEFCYCLVC